MSRVLIVVYVTVCVIAGSGFIYNRIVTLKEYNELSAEVSELEAKCLSQKGYYGNNKCFKEGKQIKVITEEGE